jgi:hypothetical protein
MPRACPHGATTGPQLRHFPPTHTTESDVGLIAGRISDDRHRRDRAHSNLNSAPLLTPAMDPDPAGCRVQPGSTLDMRAMRQAAFVRKEARAVDRIQVACWTSYDEASWRTR